MTLVSRLMDAGACHCWSHENASGVPTDIDWGQSLMSSAEHFQNLVLGGGEAGKYIAWELARSGQRVAVVEKGLIGGSCPNIACLPSKNVIHSAKVADLIRGATTFGPRPGPLSVDMAGVRQHKRDMVD